jgi:hypothetical protein
MKCKVATLLLDWQAEVDITSTLIFLYRKRLLNTRQLAGGMKAAPTRLVNRHK